MGTRELNHFRLLGHSGLRVSPLCLGTMTFGTEHGWGADKKESRRILYRTCRYLSDGCVFVYPVVILLFWHRKTDFM